jgi:hypothetical protein
VKPRGLKKGVMVVPRQKGLHYGSEALRMQRERKTAREPQEDTPTIDVSKTISIEVDESEIAASPVNFGKGEGVRLDHQKKIGFARKELKRH